MKKHYDFSKAVQGKMHRPAKSLRIPVYLDPDVQHALARCKNERSLSKMVNEVLRTQLHIVRALK